MSTRSNIGGVGGGRMVGQKLTQNDKDWCAWIFPKNDDFIHEQSLNRISPARSKS